MELRDTRLADDVDVEVEAEAVRFWEVKFLGALRRRPSGGAANLEELEDGGGIDEVAREDEEPKRAWNSR